MLSRGRIQPKCVTALMALFVTSAPASTRAHPIHTVEQPTPSIAQTFPFSWAPHTHEPGWPLAAGSLHAMRMHIESEPAAPMLRPMRKSLRQAIVETATRYLGARYGLPPSSTRVDCSGLVHLVYREHGISLPRRARDQVRWGRAVDWHDVEAGDLLFFAKSPHSKQITHVAIALNDRKMIHASSVRHSVVIDRIDVPYYRQRNVAVRRLIEAHKNEP